jgi:phage N-6-adenine-methyltransferase
MLTEAIAVAHTPGTLLPLDTLGGTIKAHIAAGDKATGKAEEHYKAAGIHLSEAKERVAKIKGQTWPAFLIKHCQIGRRRADELISIADGRTSLVKIREGYAKANAKRNTGHVHAQSSEILQQEQDETSSTRLSSFSGDNEWYTPAKYIELAREVLGEIDLDPASNAFAQKTVKAKNFYNVETNGLDKKWSGTVWMNPPYSNPEIQQFTEKLVEGIKSKSVSAAIVLTNNSGDTGWHHNLANVSSAICITLGRIKFESPTRDSNSPAMGQSFFYFGNSPDKFARVFASIGRIYQNYIFYAASSAANDNEPLSHKHAA